MLLILCAFHVLSSRLINYATLILVSWPSSEEYVTQWVSLFEIHATPKKLVVLPSPITRSPSRYSISMTSTRLDHIHDALEPLVDWRKFPSWKYMPQRTLTHNAYNPRVVGVINWDFSWFHVVLLFSLVGSQNSLIISCNDLRVVSLELSCALSVPTLVGLITIFGRVPIIQCMYIGTYSFASDITTSRLLWYDVCTNLPHP